MTSADQRPSPRPYRAAAGAALVALVAALLYVFPPVEGGVYPSCPSRLFTGLHCPGCGTLRGLHALLHGDPIQAAAFNVLSLIALPFLLIRGSLWIWATAIGRPDPSPRLPAWMIWLIFGAIVLFAVLRNLPVAPFDRLAPHRLGA